MSAVRSSGVVLLYIGRYKSLLASACGVLLAGAGAVGIVAAVATFTRSETLGVRAPAVLSILLLFFLSIPAGLGLLQAGSVPLGRLELNRGRGRLVFVKDGLPSIELGLEDAQFINLASEMWRPGLMSRETFSLDLRYLWPRRDTLPRFFSGSRDGTVAIANQIWVPPTMCVAERSKTGELGRVIYLSTQAPEQAREELVGHGVEPMPAAEYSALLSRIRLSLAHRFGRAIVHAVSILGAGAMIFTSFWTARM